MYKRDSDAIRRPLHPRRSSACQARQKNSKRRNALRLAEGILRTKFTARVAILISYHIHSDWSVSCLRSLDVSTKAMRGLEKLREVTP